MKLSNILLVILIAGLNIVPLLVPEPTDYLYNYYNNMANGKIACHCNKMKDMQESVRKNYDKDHKIAYIVDCDSPDDPDRGDDHIPPVRLFAEYSGYHAFMSLLSLFSPYDFSPIARHLSLDTPPPKYSA